MEIKKGNTKLTRRLSSKLRINKTFLGRLYYTIDILNLLNKFNIDNKLTTNNIDYDVIWEDFKKSHFVDEELFISDSQYGVLSSSQLSTVKEITINVLDSDKDESPVKFVYTYEDDVYNFIPHLLKIDGSLVELAEPILNRHHNNKDFNINKKYICNVSHITFISFILNADNKWNLSVTLKDVGYVTDKVETRRVRISDFNKKINGILEGVTEYACY